MMIRKKIRLIKEADQTEIEALIDIGINRLVIPREIAKKIGVKPMYRIKTEHGDGSIREVDVGPVFIEIMGRGAPDWATIVEKGEVCVGAETLETLGLAVDPVTGELYPTRRFV